MVNGGKYQTTHGSYGFGLLLDLHGFTIWSTFPKKKNTVDECALSIDPKRRRKLRKVHFPKMWLSKGLSQTKSSEMRWSHRQLHPAPHEFIRHFAPWSTIANQPLNKHSCSRFLFLKINVFEGLICDLQQFLVNSNISFWRNSTCNYPKTHPNTISPHLNPWKYELWQKKHVYQQNTSWLSHGQAHLSFFCKLSNANFRNPSPPSHPQVLEGIFSAETLKTAAPGHVSWDPPGRPKRTSTLLGPGCRSPGSGCINC